MQNHRACKTLGALLVLWLAGFVENPCWAQGGDELRLKVVSKEMSQTTEAVEVSVTFAVSQAIGAAQLELVFNPDHLELRELNSGQNLNSALLENKLVNPGRLNVAFVTSEEVRGEGEILSAIFLARSGDWQQTPIAIENGRAWNKASGAEVPIVAESGSLSRVTVGPSKPTPTNKELLSPTNITPPAPQVIIQYLIPGWVYALGGAAGTTIVFLLILLFRSGGKGR